MMGGPWSYAVLNAPFLLVALGVAIVALVLAGRPGGEGRGVLAVRMLITIGVVVVLTGIFDNVMVGLGLFTYPDDLLTGIKVVLIPIEDFAYAIVAGLLLPALWSILSRRASSRVGSN